jgi:WD40 repeat protein
MTKNSFTVWELPQGAIARYGWGALCDLAVSADGTSLAAGTGMGVWWYDLATRQPVTLFETGRGMVTCIDLCSSQPLLAVSNSDKNGKVVIKVWDTLKQKCIAVMEYPARWEDEPPYNGLCSLCFSPSGQWLAASRYGSIIVDIYESLTGRVHTSLELPSEEIELYSDADKFRMSSWYFSGALAFSPDDRLFASSHGSDFITVWDITTCERIIRLIGHPDGIVYALSFSPCGQFLAAGGVRGTVQVWETDTWQLQQTYPSSDDTLMNVSYTPDGTLRAAGISYEQTPTGKIPLTGVTVWDVARKPKVLYTFEKKNYCDKEMYPIHFSNGTHLAFQSDFEVQVKTVGDAETLSILPWELGDLHSLVFSPDGQTLCAGYRQFGGVVLWDVTTHRPQRVITEPRCHIVAVYSDTATGKFYATGFPPGESDYWSNTLNLWEIGKSEPIAELTVPGGLPDRRHGMAYAPATNLLAYGNGTDANDWHENDPENGAVYVWDVASGQMRHIFRGKHTNRIHFVRLSPDGTRLISKGTDWTNRVWDVVCGKEIVEFEGFKELTHFSPIVFSPCGNLIAGVSGDRILVWDIEQCEARMIMHTPLTPDDEIPMVDPIEISPCGQYLAYGEVWQQGLEKVPVRLWDIRTGENIATFLGHPTDIQCLAFSPDSTLLASGSFDGTILLWDLKPYLRNT